MGHRFADLQQQLYSFARGEFFFVGKGDDVGAGHVLHRVPRGAVIAHAAIEQARDAGVIQSRQDAALACEAFAQCGGIEQWADQLYRHGLFEIVHALGTPDIAHAARAKALDQAIVADAQAAAGRCLRGPGIHCRELRHHRGGSIGHTGVEQAGSFVHGQQVLEFGGQCRVVLCDGRKARCAGIGIQLEQFIEQGREAFPVRFIHRSKASLPRWHAGWRVRAASRVSGCVRSGR